MWCGWSYRLSGRWDRQWHTERCCCFICCLPALSSHCTSNTLNLLLQHYTPEFIWLELYSQFVCEWVCVYWGKHFLKSGWCVFCGSLHMRLVYICVLENINAVDLNGSFHFMCVGLTAALRSCSNSWRIMCLHYACVYICVSCLCLTPAHMGLSQCVPVLCAKLSSLSSGDKEASHFMWPYRSRLQPRSLQGSCHSSF